MVTIARARRGLVLLQGGQGSLMSSPGEVKPRVCVIHRCERAGDTERSIRLGGKDVAVLVCSWHTDVAPGEAPGERPLHPQTGS